MHCLVLQALHSLLVRLLLQQQLLTLSSHTPPLRQVALGALQPGERAEVLRCCAGRMPLAPDVQLGAVAARLRGFVAADVAAVAAEAALLCAVEAVQAAEAAGRHVATVLEEPGFLESLRVSAAHFEAAVERLGPSVLCGLAPEVPAVRWDDIGGLQVGRGGGMYGAAEWQAPGGLAELARAGRPRARCPPQAAAAQQPILLPPAPLPMARSPCWSLPAGGQGRAARTG